MTKTIHYDLITIVSFPTKTQNYLILVYCYSCFEYYKIEIYRYN